MIELYDLIILLILPWGLGVTFSLRLMDGCVAWPSSLRSRSLADEGCCYYSLRMGCRRRSAAGGGGLLLQEELLGSRRRLGCRSREACCRPESAPHGIGGRAATRLYSGFVYSQCAASESLSVGAGAARLAWRCPAPAAWAELDSEGAGSPSRAPFQLPSHGRPARCARVRMSHPIGWS